MPDRPPREEPLPSDGRPVFALVLAYSREEPDRAGEVALLTAPCLLGRGGSRPDDPLPRAVLLRQRPGESVLRGPLRGERLARRLLTLEPGVDALAVRAHGRTGLRLNGTPVAAADATPGDVLALDDELIFFVAQHPALLAPGVGAAAFPFGSLDAAGIAGESVAAWDLREQLAAAALASGPVLLHAPAGADKAAAAKALGPAATVEVRAAAGEVSELLQTTGSAGLLLEEVEALSVAQQEALAIALVAPPARPLRVVLATSADPALLAPALRARLACLVEVPPLDARREDVPLLLAHHARLLGPADNAAPVPGPRLVEALLRHPLDQGARWLQTVVARSSEGSRPGTLELTPAVEKLLGAEPLSPLAPAPGEAELAQAMARAGGNLTNAARMLGLRNRYALSHRLRERGALPRLV